MPTSPYLTLPAGRMPARQTPSAEAPARAQCASLTDLKVQRLRFDLRLLALYKYLIDIDIDIDRTSMKL